MDLKCSTRSARNSLPAIVFVTAFDQHAVRAFEARALDYLLKPTTQARLHEALERVRERLASSPPAAVPQPLLDFLAERETAAGRVRRIAVRSGERIVFVPAEEIDWVEAAGNYVDPPRAQGDTHPARNDERTGGAACRRMSFLRVSRFAIVNLRRVKELRSVAPSEHVAILADAQQVAVTRPLREVEERLRFA